MNTRMLIPAKPTLAPHLASGAFGILRRKCACGGSGGATGECAACAKKKLQRRAASSGPETVPPIVHDVLRSPGQPLDAQTRSFFEPRFGHDFSKVRVHADARAAHSARAVNARAYTVARDVVFDSGQHAPQTSEGQRLLAHELTHVVQQREEPDVPPSRLQIGSVNGSYERQADDTANSIGRSLEMHPIASLDQSHLQRDAALPPRGRPAPVVNLTPDQVQDAIKFNKDRFSDLYSIRLIRDVIGLTPEPVVVDEDFVRAVAEWQAERHLTQDGRVGHLTTRSIYLELVAEGEFREAILLVMDSYQLPGDLRLNNVRVGSGPDCCDNAAAVTSGGPHCGPAGAPINICFCLAEVPRTAAGYDHFVRIVGHELIHVPQCAAGTGNLDVEEFEAFFFEVCNVGRAPQLTAAERLDHANLALGHFAAIPAALQTAARLHMRDQFNAVVAAHGVGPC